MDLSLDQHQKLLNAILVYLKSLEGNNSIGAVQNHASLSQAIQQLESATGLSSTSTSNQHDISPLTLASIFSKSVPASNATTGGSDFQTKFERYLSVLKERGYFKNAVEGTPEYEALVEKARAKLMERTEGAQPTPASGPSSSTTSSSTPISDDVKARAEELKNLGNQKLTAKDEKEAIRLYSEAIALVPNNAIYYANRAAAYSQMGDHMKAISDCKEAIMIDPKYTKAYSRLGLAYFALERYEEAVSEGYEKALMLEPNNQLAKESLAAAKQKMKEKASSSTAGQPQQQPNPLGGGGGLGGLSSMLSNLMGSLGGNGGAPGGMPDFAGMMNNPQFMQMAQQMAQNPEFQQIAEQVASNPDLLNNLGGMFGGGAPKQ